MANKINEKSNVNVFGSVGFTIYSSFASSEVKGVKGVIAPYGR